MTIEGVDVGKVKNFPFSALKMLGSVQIGLGIICICIGFVDFLMFIFFEDKFLPDPKIKNSEDYQKIDTLTKTFSPVWCGIWFCVTGSFAAMLSEKKMANINYYKMTFLILSITCAGVSGPLCFIVSVTSAYLRHEITPEGYRWLVPLLTTFFAFCEILFAIISASVCCCCSPFHSSKVRVLLAKQQNDEFHAVVNTEKTKDSFDIFTTSDKRGNPLPPRREEIRSPQKEVIKQRPVPKDEKSIKPPPKEEKKIEKTQPLNDRRDHKKSRELNPPERKKSAESVNKRQDSEELDNTRYEDEEPRTRGYNNRPFTKDSSYEQLKSLAIPRTAPKQTF